MGRQDCGLPDLSAYGLIVPSGIDCPSQGGPSLLVTPFESWLKIIPISWPQLCELSGWSKIHRVVINALL